MGDCSKCLIGPLLLRETPTITSWKSKVCMWLRQIYSTFRWCIGLPDYKRSFLSLNRFVSALVEIKSLAVTRTASILSVFILKYFL